MRDPSADPALRSQIQTLNSRPYRHPCPAPVVIPVHPADSVSQPFPMSIFRRVSRRSHRPAVLWSIVTLAAVAQSGAVENQPLVPLGDGPFGGPRETEYRADVSVRDYSPKNLPPAFIFFPPSRRRWTPW